MKGHFVERTPSIGLWVLCLTGTLLLGCTDNAGVHSTTFTLATATATRNHQRIEGGTAAVKRSTGETLRTVRLDDEGFFAAGIRAPDNKSDWLVLEVTTEDGQVLRRCVKPSELAFYQQINEFTSTACEQLAQGVTLEEARAVARRIHGVPEGGDLGTWGSYHRGDSLRAGKSIGSVTSSFAGSAAGVAAQNMGGALASAGFGAILDAAGLTAVSGLLGLGGDGIGEALEQIFEKLDQISNQFYEVQRELAIQHQKVEALTALVSVKARQEKALTAANGCSEQRIAAAAFVNKVTRAIDNYFVLSKVRPGALTQEELTAHFWNNVNFLQKMRQFADPNNGNVSLLTRDVRILYIKCRYAYLTSAGSAALITSELYEQSASLVAYYTQLQYMAMISRTLGEAAGPAGKPAQPLDEVVKTLEPNESALAEKLHRQLFIPRDDSEEPLAVLKSRVPDGAFVDARSSKIWLPSPPPSSGSSVEPESRTPALSSADWAKARKGWAWARSEVLAIPSVILPLQSSALSSKALSSISSRQCVPAAPVPRQ